MDRRNCRGFHILGNAWLWAALGCLLLAGCGGDDFMTTYPAGGTAKFRGKPMQHARVTLYPLSHDEEFQAVLPSGVVGEDGTYQMGTYRFADGAPAGEYKLTIVWPSGPESESESPGFVRDRLRGRYADSQASTISVTIQSGDNTLPPIEPQ